MPLNRPRADKARRPRLECVLKRDGYESAHLAPVPEPELRQRPVVLRLLDARRYRRGSRGRLPRRHGWGFTVVASRGPFCIKQLRRVEDDILGTTLRVPVDNRDAVLAGHLGHGVGRCAIAGLCQLTHRVDPNVVPGQVHFGANQQVDALRRGVFRDARQPLEIPIDPRWSRLTLIDCDSHQNDTAVRQSGSSIGPMSAKTSPGPGLSGWVRPPKCRWIPQTAFNAVCTAPSTQAGVHEMSSPARKMPR